MAVTRSTGGIRTAFCQGAAALSVAVAAGTLSGCSVLATPHPAPLHDSSLAPSGAMGYVVCPNAVTPVELTTRTSEADIPLAISGTPGLGNFAIATSPDGRWAYVVTSDGVVSGPSSSVTSIPPVTTAAPGSPPSASSAPRTALGVRNVVVPIDLVTQRALRPIVIPGQGGTHAIVVLPGGHTVLASSGSTIVPIDAATRQVGTPLDFGQARTVFGMALNPQGTRLYALVAGGVVPVTTDPLTAGAEIVTGLSVSSVYSPHGIVVTGDGSTVYVVGQGGADFGGRVLPIVTATNAPQAATGFDKFGIADPAALALTTDGASLLVVDSANNWVNPVSLATFADPPAPVRLPPLLSEAPTSGTEHPTDIVVGPGHTGAFVVDGFSAVVPYSPTSETFGRLIRVCSGASSMVVAPAPG